MWSFSGFPCARTILAIDTQVYLLSELMFKHLNHEGHGTILAVPADMIVGTLRILPPPNRRDDVLEVLRSLQGIVLAQPGCNAFHIYEENGSEETVVLVEEWESKPALEAHLRSEAYRRILVAIELSVGAPEIRFDFVSASEGMDLIARSRRPVSQ